VDERDVTVNVDARAPRASWLWKFLALALLALGVLELASIERHLPDRRGSGRAGLGSSLRRWSATRREARPGHGGERRACAGIR
jgi:hypothetical protein